jgi:hypothetical protein
VESKGCFFSFACIIISKVNCVPSHGYLVNLLETKVKRTGKAERTKKK